MTVVLDSSAVLAVIFDEPGRDRAAAALADARIGAVNLSEVVAKLADRGYSDADLRYTTAGLATLVQDFDMTQAVDAGMLRRGTRTTGLSLGDRCCLALAQSLGVPVLTADRAWADLDLGVAVEVIR
jgi:PIN domain nuclease of toxin-antitoxin system